jgi:hypothetical protein
LRSRLSSSRSLSLNGPSPSRARRSRFTHRPSVPWCGPCSRANCAIGRPSPGRSEPRPLGTPDQNFAVPLPSLPQRRRLYGTRGGPHTIR